MKKKNAQKCPEGNTKPQGRHRAYVFTSYKMDKEPFFSQRMKYLLYAPEICPKTKRKHWQGFVYYYDKVSLNVSQKELNTGECHHQPARAELVESQKAYIIGPYDDGKGKTKPFNPDHKVFGNEPTQGKRTDLDELKVSILEGKSVDDVVLEHPVMYHQYGRTLNKIEDIRMSKMYRTEMTTAEWICGPTGIGKSHYAFKNFSPETHYVLPNDNGWWDDYKQQETVIINDFRGHIAYNELLQMIDKWPFNVKRRGRPPLPFTSKHVIITSSLDPRQVYHNREDEDGIEQLLRRIELLGPDELKARVDP